MKSYSLPIEFVTSEKITIDYLNQANKITQVFPKHFREPRVRRCNVDRERLVERLLEYNEKIEAPKRVLRNIESLSHPETYVVITGQQPGLFSGPLYTMYKAISTIILCERLSTPKHLLVPIFWNASEDHDLSEVNHIILFRENEPYQILYDCAQENVAFSHLSLDSAAITKMMRIIGEVSPNSEFKVVLLRELEEIIQKSSTLGDFFSKFMMHFFGERGLIMVEPQDFRELMVPVFTKLIKQPAECTRILNEGGLELDKLGYSSRIHKRSNMCNFFLLNEYGKRLRVTYNGKFQTASATFSERELLNLLEDDPSRFSANAVTRPITQDLLFPTFAYVAGPNEIAYQAQLTQLYDFFSLEMPIVFPRFGATIVERKVSKVLEKYRVKICDLRNPERLLKELAKEKMDGTFTSFKSEVSNRMAEVTRQAQSIDEDLTRPCSLAEGRIFKAIDVLEDKIASKLKAQNVVVRQQITKAHRNIFPNSQLQERQMNVLEYLIKYGREFLRIIHENLLKADYGEHMVITC